MLLTHILVQQSPFLRSDFGLKAFPCPLSLVPLEESRTNAPPHDLLILAILRIARERLLLADRAQ